MLHAKRMPHLWQLFLRILCSAIALQWNFYVRNLIKVCLFFSTFYRGDGLVEWLKSGCYLESGESSMTITTKWPLLRYTVTFVPILMGCKSTLGANAVY